MKKLINILFISLLTFVSGCSKYLDKLDNPNLVTDPPLNGLLAEATFESGMDIYRLGDRVSYFTQYLASDSKGSDADVYNEVDYTSTWTNFYETMMNIRQMNDRAIEKGASLHLGVGEILMALHINLLINTFGDIPYSDALTATLNLTPKFDTQAALYDTTLKLLDDAVVQLSNPNPAIEMDGASDVIHGGNAAAWIKTAYALKARFLNQMTKKPTYDPAAVLSALQNAYTSNGDDAMMTAFFGRSPYNQVAYDNSVLNLDGWLSSQFVDATNGKTFGIADPRLPLIATITKFGDYRGTPNGAGRIGTGTDDEESYLSLNGFYSKGGAPLLIVTYSEMKFIESEAAFRANDLPTAYAAYLDGIKSHMEKLGVSPADENNYVNNPAVSVGASNITLDLIFKEKYVAMFLNPESWVDARRFDYKYKDFSLPEGAAMSTFIRRLAYPSVETSRNGANVPTVTGLDQKLNFDN